MRTQVQSLALLSGLRIWGCCELGCRSQAWLRSGIAVAVVQAGSCSFNSTPSLGTSICHRCGPKKMTKKKKKSESPSSHQCTCIKPHEPALVGKY